MPAYDRSQLKSLKTGYFYHYFSCALRKLDFTTFLLDRLSLNFSIHCPLKSHLTKGQSLSS